MSVSVSDAACCCCVVNIGLLQASVTCPHSSIYSSVNSVSASSMTSSDLPMTSWAAAMLVTSHACAVQLFTVVVERAMTTGWLVTAVNQYIDYILRSCAPAACTVTLILYTLLTALNASTLTTVRSSYRQINTSRLYVNVIRSSAHQA